jgi:hypothetical protein
LAERQITKVAMGSQQKDLIAGEEMGGGAV